MDVGAAGHPLGQHPMIKATLKYFLRGECWPAPVISAPKRLRPRVNLNYELAYLWPAWHCVSSPLAVAFIRGGFMHIHFIRGEPRVAVLGMELSISRTKVIG